MIATRYDLTTLTTATYAACLSFTHFCLGQAQVRRRLLMSCFRMNLQKPSHNERFSFLTKFQNFTVPLLLLILLAKYWHAMSTSPAYEFGFLVAFLLGFFHALVKHWYDSFVHKNSTPRPSICQGSPWNRWWLMGQIALWLLFDRNELDHLFAVSVQLQLLLPKCNWWEITQISGIGLGEPNADIYFRNCRSIHSDEYCRCPSIHLLTSFQTGAHIAWLLLEFCDRIVSAKFGKGIDFQ